jgi:amino acid permease
MPQGRREVARVVRGATPTHMHLRSRITFLVGASLIVAVVGSVLIYLFERDQPGTGITNFGDSIFWTTTQLLTVSSQLPNPLSTPARVLDIFLQAYAISAVAVLAGSFGAFFNRRGLERDKQEQTSDPATSPTT